MKNYYVIFILSFALTACAGVNDVVSSGGDTYMVASHGTMGWSSGPAQKAKAMNQANEFCQSKGKQMQIISSSDSGNGGFGKISEGEVSFSCITPTTSTAVANSSGKTSISDKLKELNSLHEQGLITDSEYNTKKQEILKAL